MDPLISIIVPTHNEAENISDCLKSILKQNYKNIELIVVDNFSTDKTLTIARKYTNNCFRSGKERSAQRNYGAKKAKGKYLMFVDADMKLTNNCLLEAVKKIKDEKIIISFPEQSLGKNFLGESVSLERNLYQKERILAGARFFTRKLFEKLGGFDENLIAGEDWDISIRAQRLGYKLTFTKSRLIHSEKTSSLLEILKKKQYYSQNIHIYAQKHPKEFKLQSSLKIRLSIYLKNWRILIKNPPHTLGFIFIKALTWYNWSKLKKNRHQK